MQVRERPALELAAAATGGRRPRRAGSAGAGVRPRRPAAGRRRPPGAPEALGLRRRRLLRNQLTQPLDELRPGLPVRLERSRPFSVSGWSSIWRKTFAGTVATSHPSRAAVTTCSGWRIEAASTSVVVPPGRSVATISSTTVGRVDRDVVQAAHEAGRVGGARLRGQQRLVGREHERHVDADALGRTARAWRPGPRSRTGPSRPRARAARPAHGPPRSSPAASSETTSALTGPPTRSQIRRTMSPGSPFSLASSEGFVVAPERIPQAAISSTSATDPVSMKNLIAPFPSSDCRRGFRERSAGRRH